MSKLSRGISIFITIIASILVFYFPETIFAAPLITNTEIRNIGYTSVTVVWKTDLPTNSQINYGEKSVDAYKSPVGTLYDTDHSITLTSLRPATKYNFQITSATEQGDTVTSAIQQFSTLSFTFDDDQGTFANINTTPTPTPYYNPYAQYVPQSSNPYQQPMYQQQPVYLVPPVVYQQGQTLGQSNTQVVAPTQAPMDDNVIVSLVQSGIWGIVILFTILIVILVLLFNQLMKNKKELHDLQQQVLSYRPQESITIKREEPEKKVYRFDVRS